MTLFTFFIERRLEMRRVFWLLGFMIVMSGMPLNGEEPPDSFSVSLHHTGEGMRYWYEAKDGFMKITGVPYDQLSCKGCHVAGCQTCHLKQTKEGAFYSTKKASSTTTCLRCHSREKATISLDTLNQCGDVHRNSFLTCIDCHSHQEIHGNGTQHKSMRAPGAMTASCTNCHTQTSVEFTAIPDSPSHDIHMDELECNACHVQNTMACYNCHFGELARTKSKPKSFTTKVKDFLLLVKYNGKITSGTLQTLVGKNNEPFICYVPYYTHSITKEARKCEECHGTKAATLLSAGKEFKPAVFKDGSLEFYNGVIPLVPDLLKWPFLEKKNGKWVEFTPSQPPLIQLAVYAEPFSQEELDALVEPQVYEE